MLIAQISDLHICDDGVLYNGVADTNAMAAAAVAHLNRLDPAPDLVILTGDLCENGTASQYAVARRILGALKAPLFLIPGNHDDREAFRAAFADHPGIPASGPINFAVTAGSLRLIAIDVTIPGLHHGEASAETLAWLEKTLAADPETPTVLALHQPPILSGIPYLDDYRCMNPEPLAALIATYPAVERVICGHVHRVMTRRWAGTVLITAPSTATQIALGLRPESPPESFLEPPGCLLHHWTPETGLISHLSPIGAFPGPFPFA